MSRVQRISSESRAARLAFLRRRTTVFFTFVFPLLIVVIFGALVRTQPGGGGLFTESPVYYVPGYLAVVVLFTPLSRIGSEVARHREGNRFEKLATTPLRRWEWLVAQTAVNVGIIGVAALLVLVLMALLTGASLVLTPTSVVLLALFVVAGVALFCGVGALLGRIADSQDGVIAASNTLALPLLFLSETFVPQSLLPGWLPTWLSPLTYFSRGVRAAVTGGVPLADLAVLVALAVVALAAGAWALPVTD
ncbi:MAG: ABC transporter permease [Haloarculaceae archaeon]